MKQKLYGAISLCLISGLFNAIQCQSTLTISVNSGQVKNANAKKLLGSTFDARSGADYDATGNTDAVGYHDPATGLLNQPLWNRVPLGGVRYPANMVVYNWNWSYTIGEYQDRTAQPMGTGGSLSQKLQFGFDEFMDMVESKNLSTSEAQIMVNIYASVGQPDPAVLAADWVEYCNTPFDTINPRGGTNWAALRAANGRTQPYGVSIWNIGNEPWTNAEFGNTTSSADAYMAVASRIIDSMLSVDPSIRITIPAVGNGSSPWNAQIMNPNAPYPLLGKIYGLSPHAFYDNDAATPNPNVSQVLASLSNLVSVAAGKGLAVILGDHAHFAPNGDPDKAVRWEGALTTCDLLLGISQINNIELANFWLFGNTKATWHPIRENGNGSYTFMAVAQLYETLYPYFYDQSLYSTIVNASGGGAVSNMRVSAFQRYDQSQGSIIAINTSSSVDNQIIPPVWNGLNLQSVKLLTASSLSQDTFITTWVNPLPNGYYSAPHEGILIFDFSQSPLAVQFIDPVRAYFADDAITIEWATANEENCDRYEVERKNNKSNFKKITTIDDCQNEQEYHLYKAKDQAPENGINYYRIKQIDENGDYMYSKIVSAAYRQNEINVYPNPSSNLIYFTDSEIITKIEIINSLGSVEKTIQPEDNQINISNLSGGVYTLRFWDSNQQITVKKIIKR